MRGGPILRTILVVASLSALPAFALEALENGGANPAPPPREIPLPAAGDAAVYRVGVYGMTPGAGPMEVAFAWDLGGEPVVMGTVTRGEGPLPLHWPETFSLRFSQGIVPEESRLHYGSPPWESTNLGLSESVSRRDLVTYGAPLGPLACLARAGWQGTPLGTLPNLTYTTLCPQGGGEFLRGAEPDFWNGTEPFQDLGWVTRVDTPLARHFRAEAQQHAITLRHDWWLVPGLPYPVMFRMGVHNGNWTITESTFTLAGFLQGPGSVPWGLWEDPRPEPLPATPAGPWGPAEGEGPTTVFPLEDAVAIALEDPRLLAFHLWRESHPDARLLRAAYTSSCWVSGYGAVAQRTVEWNLLFGDPGGQGHNVRLRGELAQDAPGTPVGVQVAGDVRSRATRPFDPRWIPDAMPSLSEAVAAAKGIFPAFPAPLGLEYVVGPGGPRLTLVAASCVSRAVDEGHVEDRGIRYEVAFNLTSGRPVSWTRWDGHTVTAPQWAPRVVDHWRKVPPYVPPSQGGVAWEAADASSWLPGTAAAGALLYLLYRFVQWLFWSPFPLAIRRDPDQVLKSQTRRTLYELLAREPGLCLSDLRARLHAPSTVLLHHLRVLASANLITSIRAPRRIHWFVSGRFSPVEMRRIAASRSPSARALLEVVREHPGLTQVEMARTTGMTPSRVSRTLSALESFGLVARVPVGRVTKVYPKDRS